MVMNGLGNANAQRKIPVTIVNTTGWYFNIKKGNVLAQISQVSDINQMVKDNNPKQTQDKLFAYKHQSLPEIPGELSEKQCQSLTALSEKNRDVFTKDEFDIGKSSILKAHLNTGNGKPIRKKPYRSPVAYRPEIKR